MFLSCGCEVSGEVGPGTTMALGRQKLGVQLEREAAWKSQTGELRTCLSLQGDTKHTFLWWDFRMSPGPGGE